MVVHVYGWENAGFHCRFLKHQRPIIAGLGTNEAVRAKSFSQSEISQLGRIGSQARDWGHLVPFPDPPLTGKGGLGMGLYRAAFALLGRYW